MTFLSFGKGSLFGEPPAHKELFTKNKSLARRGKSRQPSTSLKDLASERVANGIDNVARSVQHAVEIDAMLDTQAIQQINQVFGGEVARSAWAGKGAAAQATGRAVVAGDAVLQAG